MSRSKKVNSKAGEKDDQPQAQEPPALNGPETTSAKRPGNMINNDSPKKTPPRKSIKLDGPKARQFTIFTTATAVEDIEAYYIEQYPGQDGFAFHLWQDIMQERNATDLNDAGFFFCGDRRVSKEDNSPLENIERAKNGKKYTRRYVLRSLPASEGERMSTPETRDEGLHVLLKVSIVLRRTLHCFVVRHSQPFFASTANVIRENTRHPTLYLQPQTRLPNPNRCILLWTN